MQQAVHIVDYHVSRKTGFLLDRPLEFLPEYFSEWNRLAKAMPDLVARHSIRHAVHELPELDFDNLCGYKQQRLAHLQLTMIAAGYVWEEGEGGASERLPSCVAIPLWGVSQALGLKPIISHPAVCLANWKYTDESGNIKCLYETPGGSSCEWFFRVTCNVEFAFAKGVDSIQDVLDGTFANDIDKVVKGLDAATITLQNMLQEMKRMHEHLTADTFFNVIRPYLAGWGGESNPLPLGLIYEGILSNKPYKCLGGSAAQSSTLQLFDSILGVEHKPDKRLFLLDMRQYMPKRHKELLEDLDKVPCALKQMVDKSEDNALFSAYKKCLESVTTFRTYHIQLITKYVVIAAKKQTQNNNFTSLSTKGTGGTDLLPFLKELRDDTKTTF